MRTPVGAFLLALVAATPAIGQVPVTPSPQAGPIDAMDRVLSDWAGHAADLKTVDVRYTVERNNRLFKTTSRGEGRLVLKAPNRFSVEAQFIKDNGVAEFRDGIIWDGADWLHWSELNPESILKRPLSESQEGRVPWEASLPFMFGVTADEARRRFDFTLLSETATQYTIQAVPRDLPRKSGGTTLPACGFDRAFVVLDKKTFLPVLFAMDQNRVLSTYRAVAIRRNEPVSDDVFHAETHLKTVPAGKT
ncbi:MAG TPA: hypothetical protein VG406_12790 [Isosphaeraceae bacterium]|jgi:hypothetical protein|nr:hypothetical protein [Isosphaeraceae bacterium]